MSDLPSYANAQTAVAALAIKLAREQGESSRVNEGLTEETYEARDALVNDPKQAGANGVLKGADNALVDGSPYQEGTDVSTAVPE